MEPTATDLTEQQVRDCYGNLNSAACLGCTGAKKKRQSFCAACYRSLPHKVRRNLYVVTGYPTTFYSALNLIKATNDATSRPLCLR